MIGVRSCVVAWRAGVAAGRREGAAPQGGCSARCAVAGRVHNGRGTSAPCAMAEIAMDRGAASRWCYQTRRTIGG
ncbi:unnamed protein product, partial [Iphiclides podalirius]